MARLRGSNSKPRVWPRELPQKWAWAYKQTLQHHQHHTGQAPPPPGPGLEPAPTTFSITNTQDSTRITHGTNTTNGGQNNGSRKKVERNKKRGNGGGKGQGQGGSQGGSSVSHGDRRYPGYQCQQGGYSKAGSIAHMLKSTSLSLTKPSTTIITNQTSVTLLPWCNHS